MGALDGEVAYLAEHITKSALFRGGVSSFRAALLADGLAGGGNRVLVDRLRIRAAGGTVLDNLLFIPPEAVRKRLGIDDGG